MEENKFQIKGFVVWIICALFFLYEFFIRTVIGTFQHPLMQDLHLSSVQFSVLSTTMFLLIYGLMQIPAGILLDQIGLKKTMLIAIVACIVSTLGFAYSYNFPLAILFRMMMGFGAAFGFICLLISVSDWMPHKYSAIFIGISQFIGTLGPMLSAGPLEALSHSKGVDWRSIFLVLSLVGFILGVLIFLFVENNKAKAGKYVVLKRAEKISKSVMRLFKRSQPWFLALFSATVYFTVEYLSENEGRHFLIEKGISPIAASYMLTTAWIGYAIGCPLFGVLSDLFQRRKFFMSLAAIMGLISITTIIYSPEKLLIEIAFFFLGMSASGQSIGFATVTEQFKKEHVAIGFGLNNAVIMILAASNAPLIGYLLDSAKDGATATLSDYFYVFHVLIVILAISTFTALFLIKETFCKSVSDFTYLRITKKPVPTQQ